VRAKGVLRDAGIQFDELVLNRDYGEVTLRAVAGVSMVPQVFVNGEHIGGSDQLEEYLARREKAAA
jgi:glutaredoxin